MLFANKDMSPSSDRARSPTQGCIKGIAREASNRSNKSNRSNRSNRSGKSSKKQFPELTQAPRSISTFVKRFRAHFIDAMAPKYMPSNWTVDLKITRAFGKHSQFHITRRCKNGGSASVSDGSLSPAAKIQPVEEE